MFYLAGNQALASYPSSGRSTYLAIRLQSAELVTFKGAVFLITLSATKIHYMQIAYIQARLGNYYNVVGLLSVPSCSTPE